MTLTPPSTTHTDRTPISIVSGFLGAGKTTLVNQLLADPAMANTAMIVNEFGDISIDDSLIRNATGTMIELSNGCVCCVLQGTLAETIATLGQSSLDGIDRVLVETTGLANVGPIVHTIVSDNRITDHFMLGRVITLVDAVNGPLTLDRHPESVEQVAVADVIVVSKADLASETESLLDRLHQLAVTSQIIVADRGDVDLDALFARPAIERLVRSPDAEHHDTSSNSMASRSRHPHDDHMSSVSVRRDRPLERSELHTFWAAVAEQSGANLLRVKGLVNVVGAPGPAVVQGAQDVLSDIEWLDEWPSDDHTTRLVFIGWDLDADEIEALVP